MCKASLSSVPLVFPLSGRWSTVWNIQCQTLKTRRRKKKKHLSALCSPVRAGWCGGLIKRVGGVEHDEVCSDSYFTPWTLAPLVDSCVCWRVPKQHTWAREPHTHRESWALAGFTVVFVFSRGCWQSSLLTHCVCLTWFRHKIQKYSDFIFVKD